ncbi:MAG: nucleotidyl transferase AbiEii/AbiGii toxin family protein [Candidatus Gracilibacteria bacterium]|jgi:predicted nucleotidyltransferase component of viral defense system
MLLPHPSDAVHKSWLYRLLAKIADNPFLMEVLRFKGGTCASMRGIINRFSVDLDFDLIDESRAFQTRKELENIFAMLGLEIKDCSSVAPQYFLRYKNESGKRNTLKLDITFPPPKNNEYEAVRFTEIDRIIYCHTIPTMFANKLVAIMERYKKYGSVSGRDIFDIHTFFMKGYKFKPEIVEERTGKTISKFLHSLRTFIEKHVTQTVIDQDLNSLLPNDIFALERKFLKDETLMFLKENEGKDD